MKREEAIKTVKNNWPEGRLMLQEALQTLIPELNESEDERIRKELIRLFQSENTESYGEFTNKQLVAWLEKQGGQKPAWSEEDESGFGDAMWAIKQAMSIAKDENDMGNLWYAERWIKSIKERMKGE